MCFLLTPLIVYEIVLIFHCTSTNTNFTILSKFGLGLNFAPQNVDAGAMILLIRRGVSRR